MHKHNYEDEEEGQALLGEHRGPQPASPLGAEPVSSSEEPTRNRTCVQSMREAGKKVKQEVVALYLALADPDCGWKARVMVVLVLCYALSPLDWIPELIPVLALLVDFILLPLMLWACVKLMPPEVLERARARARSHSLSMSGDWKLVAFVYIIWLLNVVVLVRLIGKHTSSKAYFHNHQLKLMAIGGLVMTLLFVLLTWWRLHVEQDTKDGVVTGSPRTQQQQRLLSPA